MATSAFRSATKRNAIGGSSSQGSAGRRSRSLSRFSRPMAPEAENETDCNSNAPRGKFVNTKRGSASPFPVISLDDLALELFSSSSKNDTESDGLVEREEREGRSVSRRAEVGRLASDTASSRRRGRSVSKTRGGVVSGSSNSGAKKVISADAGSRRRRSLSVVRHRISDSESDVDHSWNSNNATLKAPSSGNSKLQSAPKATASSNRRLGRSRSQKDISLLHDDYSSPSSALTDDESKDSHFRKNGIAKTSRAVCAQKKAEHPAEDAANGRLYEAMRKEVRYAVEEIRTELSKTVGRNQTAASRDQLQLENSATPQDSSRIRQKYATKLEQRSSDRRGVSEILIEEAERYFEDFICNVEDTDISSFDGERSDESSSLGGTVKTKDAATGETEANKTPAGSTTHPVELDGVILPWLQWETSHDGSLSGFNKAHTPVTPKALQWDSEKDNVPCNNDQSRHSISSHGSWSPGIFQSPPIDTREDNCKTRQVAAGDRVSCFDMDEYLKLSNNEELLFDMYRERKRINSGGLLLCTAGFFY